MNSGTTLGVLAATAGLAFAGDRVRVWWQPTGTHRATPPRPDMTALAAAIESGEVESAGSDWCPECTGRGIHTFHTDGTRTCWAHGHTTPDGDA